MVVEFPGVARRYMKASLLESIGRCVLNTPTPGLSERVPPMYAADILFAQVSKGWSKNLEESAAPSIPVLGKGSIACAK